VRVVRRGIPGIDRAAPPGVCSGSPSGQGPIDGDRDTGVQRTSRALSGPPEVSNIPGEKPPKSPLEPGAGDVIQTLTRAVFSAVPVLGGPAAELLNLVVVPPIQKRTIEWLNDLGERVRQLEEQGRITVESLKGNEVFADTVLRAMRAASATGQEEKRHALRNAVLNATLPNPLDGSIQQVFLGFIDDFTVWHLRALKLFQDPKLWAARLPYEYQRLSHPSLAKLLHGAFPELISNNDAGFSGLLWRDLERAGLVAPAVFDEPRKADETLMGRTTGFGELFLRFVEEPQK
jgi:hypothetical protein